MYDLAHVGVWKPYNLRYLAHVSWVDLQGTDPAHLIAAGLHPDGLDRDLWGV